MDLSKTQVGGQDITLTAVAPYQTYTVKEIAPPTGYTGAVEWTEVGFRIAPTTVGTMPAGYIPAAPQEIAIGQPYMNITVGNKKDVTPCPDPVPDPKPDPPQEG